MELAKLLAARCRCQLLSSGDGQARSGFANGFQNLRRLVLSAERRRRQCDEIVLTSQSLTLPGRGGPCNPAGRASRSLDPNWTAARYWTPQLPQQCRSRLWPGRLPRAYPCRRIAPAARSSPG
eukprot:scaffold23832_cov57-Phaeocystis_antarctica.AAC.1